MEGNLRPEPPHPPPPSDRNRYPELAQSKIEDGKDIRRRSPDAAPDDFTAWTDEKHNSYIRHLELSFVKQLLHQSKRMSAVSKYSNQSQRDVNIIPQENVSNSSEQFNVLGNGCWKKNSQIRDNRRELWSRAKHRKKTISPSHESSSNDPYLGDLSDFERAERTGQNFFDQTKFLPRAKRSKTSLVDEGSQEISNIDSVSIH